VTFVRRLVPSPRDIFINLYITYSLIFITRSGKYQHPPTSADKRYESRKKGKRGCSAHARARARRSALTQTRCRRLASLLCHNTSSCSGKVETGREPNNSRRHVARRQAHVTGSPRAFLALFPSFLRLFSAKREERAAVHPLRGDPSVSRGAFGAAFSFRAWLFRSLFRRVRG